MVVGKGGEPGSRSRFGQSKTVIFISDKKIHARWRGF
jgi:hypothetical protein